MTDIHEKFMREAIKCAKKSESRAGCAIGAVVVKDNSIIGVGMGLASILPDVTEHGDTSAIRAACRKLNSIDLSGCVLYGTLEPCGMCLSAAIWANMDAVYFGAYANDVSDNKYEYKNYSSEKLTKNSQRWDGSKIRVEGGILRDECRELLANYKDWQRQPK